MTEGSRPGRRARGSVSLYAVSFALMLAAAGSLVVSARGFLGSTGLLWLSTALSVAAIVAALAGLWFPRHR